MTRSESHPDGSQAECWTTEVVAAARLDAAPSLASVRLAAAAAIGAVGLALALLLVGMSIGSLETGAAGVIVAPAGAAFWYLASRDQRRRQHALAFEGDLQRRLGDLETRLAAGRGSEPRRRALADLAEWLSLRSRLNGGVFDPGTWRRFTAPHGTPMAVLLGLDAPPPDQLAPSYEELDLEQERAGVSRRQLLRLALFGGWALFIVTRYQAASLRWALLLCVGALAAWELGWKPLAIRSVVAGPGRLAITALRRTRTAEAGESLAVIERCPARNRFHPPQVVLTCFGPHAPIEFAFRHENDARIPLFLASWLTPRSSAPPAHQDPSHEPRRHHPPHGAIPAGSARPAGRPAR